MAKSLFNENIKPTIISEISNAKKSIYIVVAWFNDNEIFEALLEKTADKEFEIKLILLDDDNQDKINSQLDFDRLLQSNDNVYIFKIPQDKVKIHHKFCVFDKKSVITGSYNWTYGADKKNKENAVLFVNEEEVANQYLDEFNNIYNDYCKPIIDAGIQKLKSYVEEQVRKIKHGNLQLAMEIGNLIDKLKPIEEKNDEEITSFEDFNLPITVESDDELKYKWWGFISKDFKEYLLKSVLKINSKSKIGIDTINNIISLKSIIIDKSNYSSVFHLSDIKNIISLTKLTIDGVVLDGLEYFAYLENIEYLRLLGCEIKQVSKIPQLKKLVYLNLDYNEVNSLSGIASHPNLEELTICKNPLTSLNDIDKLKNLKSLSVDLRFNNLSLENERLTKMGLSDWKSKRKRYTGKDSFEYYLITS